MGITFGGLASGIDSSSLIDQLVAAERTAATSLSTKQSALNTQKSIIGSLSNSVAALGTAVRGLDTASELRPLSASVSDAKVSVAVSSSATAASHDLRVKSLAAASVTQSRAITGSGVGALGDGGVDITVAGVTKSVTWSATDSLDAIATRINASGAGVTASVLNTNGNQFRLVLNASTTGTANAPTFVDTGTDQLGLAAGNVTPSSDAVMSINGIDVTRSTNVITDAIAGTTFTLNSLHAVTDPATKATVTMDNKAITSKVKAVVDAYNSINSALHVQLDYTGTTKGANTLFGDSTLRQLQGSLGGLMSRSWGTDTTLSTIGITRDKTGAMTLDESKLTAAIAANPNVLSDIFITNGFSTAVSTLTDSYTTSGTGLFASKTEGLTGRSTALQSQIDRINRNADNLQTRLSKQFAALEQAMSNLQSQSSQLAAILG